MSTPTTEVNNSTPVGDRGHWSGRLGFVLAASGSAIGLGNIWKFPYMTGVNGGGAFVLIYLLCIAFVGLPILLAEIYIGRESQTNAIQAFEVLHKPGSPWRFAGFLGVLSAFLILSFYSVVGGWVLDFELSSLLGTLTSASDEEISGNLGALFSNPVKLIVWHTIFMILTVGIVTGGVTKGIERAARILMPILFFLLLALFVRVMFLDGFPEALTFLFTPNFSALSSEAVLEAVGHAFFTLSLGLGAMITYGSFMNRGSNLVATAWTVAILDTVIALVAGLVIFAVVFTYGSEPNSGPTLMFTTLPLLFKQMTGGYFVAVAFFMLVAFAALTSAISLLEVIVTYLTDVRRLSRLRAALGAGVIIWVLGILCALSFNLLAESKVLGFTFFDLFDFLTAKVFMPVGGVVISSYYGWVLGPRAIRATFSGEPSGLAYNVLLWSSRIIAPGSVIYMLWHGLIDTFS